MSITFWLHNLKETWRVKYPHPWLLEDDFDLSIWNSKKKKPSRIEHE